MHYFNQKNLQSNPRVEMFFIHIDQNSIRLRSPGNSAIHGDPELEWRVEQLTSIGARRPIQVRFELGKSFLANVAQADEMHCDTFNCRDNFHDPAKQTYHLGYNKQNCAVFSRNDCFADWLTTILESAYTMAIAERHPGQPDLGKISTLHLGCWCNQGKHRSVTGVRILKFVFGEVLQMKVFRA
jgi:hypothetical protein